MHYTTNVNMVTKSPPKEVFTEDEIFFISQINEQQKRCFLATKARSLGRHGVRLVSQAVRASKDTIYKGIHEIESEYVPDKGRIRRRGGGNKTVLSKYPDLIDTFNKAIEPFKAGLPQDETVIWISISSATIAKEMNKLDSTHHVTPYIVRQIMKTLGYRERSFIKNIPMKDVEDRDAQFENISDIRNQAVEAGIALISIDTKKKELIGNFKRDGKVFCQGQPQSFDHDFGTFSEGQIVPHGIYDIQKNIGYMTIGTSHDTSEFVCNNIERVWNKYLHDQYPDSHTLVICCDGGGSNSSSHHIVKQDLMKLATNLGVNIVVMHYPPYCSKWNPIEHRLFSQITRSWKGAPLLTIDDAVKRAESTVTSTGLKVIVEIDTNEYEINRKLEESYTENLKKQVIFQAKLPKWNYLIKPA